MFASERAIGSLLVQQWVRAAAPDISPAGMCECLTVIYREGRRVLVAGQRDLATAVTVHPASGSDINRDGFADLVLTDWSGGAHCCYSISIYSLEPNRQRQLLSLPVGNCGPPDLSDLDGDGRLEIVTCDDGWVAPYCAFAFAPMPRVVLAYVERARTYEPATPRFAARFRDEVTTLLAAAEETMASNDGRDAGRAKCAVLGPALALMYQDRIEEGLAVIRSLYAHADREEFERTTLAHLKTRTFSRSTR